MKVIGIELTASELKWVLLDGTRDQGVLRHLDHNKILLPQMGNTFTDNLVAFRSQVLLSLRQAQPDCIAIIKAQSGGMYSPSIERIKMELIVELAAHELSICSSLVAGKTVDDAEKRKFQSATGATIEERFCGGSQLAPKYLRRAAFAAWTCLQ